MPEDRGPRVLRVFARLLPARFRERHLEEMEVVLRDQVAGRSTIARAELVARACIDVVRVALVERRRASRRRSNGMDAFRQDLRCAVRALRRRPGFTGVAVLTLAIGIGATTTVFSVVDGVLLRALPYASADRIGILWHEMGDGAQNLPALHPLDYYDYRDRAEVFEATALATGSEWILGGEDAPELVDVGRVESGFFEFFGARPLWGRPFTAADDRPGSAPVAVLSHRLWQRRFGGDGSIVGGRVELNGVAHEVIGVLPAWFRLHLPAEAFLLRDAEVWVPARVDPANLPPRNFTGFTAFVRLVPGATFTRAQQRLNGIEAQLRAEHPVHASSNLQVRIEPLHADVVKGARDRLVLLMGAVAFVLLIACVNVANLMLARGRSREGEFALRAALGAGRGRLARQILAESLVLALVGGVLGTLLALGGVAAVVRLGTASVPLLDTVAMDGRVLIFTLGAVVLSALSFGAIPALQAAAGRPAASLGTPARATGTRRRSRLRDALVIAEVAVSLVLLVGTGLMIRSFAFLVAVDPGFESEGRLTFRLSLPAGGYATDEARETFHRQLEERLLALPGVQQVAAISLLPLAGSGPLQPYAYDAETARNWESVTADERAITPGFFATLGARLLEGREFLAADAASDRNVIIVDDRLAARAFPGSSAVGQRLQVESDGAPVEERFAEIVGVVEHLRLHDLARPHLTQIYSPLHGRTRQSVVLRTAGDPAALMQPVRDVVTALDRGAIVQDVRTMGELTHAALAPARFALILMLGFGAIALVLACVGMYGVLAWAVAQRTREIGVRMALGERPGAIRWLVLRHGARLTGAALLIGLAGAAFTSRAAEGVLYGVNPLDPSIYLATAAALAAVALLACWVPARRATRVDPMTALRAE